MHGNGGGDVSPAFCVLSATGVLDIWLPRTLSEAIKKKHKPTVTLSTEFQENMLSWYPNFVVHECFYAKYTNTMLIFAMQSINFDTPWGM